MQDNGTVSLRICQEGHANGLALNKDFTQIAVAGKSLLKVFAIESDSFVEVCNLRIGKNQNLSFLSNDVAWSSLDTNILATAATNGVVAVWDLSKFGRQKQTIVYYEHERTAHTVAFHGSEPNVLVSGSQDGTIKYFDTRLEKSVYTYFSNSESVRDVKFSPHMGNIFAAASENGNVQLWDLRRWEKCLQQFTAHSGPIYTCDWHPSKNWLATGSRDKQIKVWNMASKASLEHTIHTIAVVGRVKWRPERTYHIASCALVTDYSIHVWDIRRPYIAFASFNEHTNVTTGIAWKGNNSHCLLSTSKDSTIYKHDFRDSTRPSLKANAHGASARRSGDISFARRRKVLSPVSTAQVVRSSVFIRQSSVGVEPFHMMQSDMCHFLLTPANTGYNEKDAALRVKEYECFVNCAKELLLTGRKLSEICDHNALVCKRYGKHTATTLWNFVKFFYGSNEFSKHQYEHRSSFSNLKNGQAARRATQVVNPLMLEWTGGGSTVGGVGGVAGLGAVAGGEHGGEHGDANAGSAELEGDPQGGDGGGNCSANSGGGCPPACSVILSETQILTEITFDNFDLLLNGFIYMGPPDFSKVFSLPDTALHHDVQAARPQADLNADNREKSPPVNAPCPLKVSTVPPVPMWEPHQFMAESIVLQNDVADLQTALSILVAIGDTRRLLPLDESLVEHWFVHYIDQLHRYQLWNEACVIINMAWPQTVRDMNQKSTTTHTNCGQCGRLLSGNTVGWYCQKCKSAESAKCCVCGLIVRGLYAWCQGCSHGGHVEHLRDYFAKHAKCPKCGHLCEHN